jgi:hypothetical protein
MGVSTNAILVFGVELGEDVPESLLGEDGSFDFEDILAADAGLFEPICGTENLSTPYWEAKRKAVAEAPVELVWHCSGEYPMYILGVPGTEKTANRGHPRTVTPSDFATPSDEKIEAFKKWCEDHDIVLEAEPAWLLCSYWS